MVGHAAALVSALATLIRVGISQWNAPFTRFAFLVKKTSWLRADTGKMIWSTRTSTRIPFVTHRSPAKTHCGTGRHSRSTLGSFEITYSISQIEQRQCSSIASAKPALGSNDSR